LSRVSGNLSQIEKTTIRKLQKRIVPFLFVLYIVAFLDRINIGFAALTMNKELAITSKQYGLVTAIFFIGYFLFEVPSNLLLHKVGARVWIARILVSWGAVAILTGFVRTAQELVQATRASAGNRLVHDCSPHCDDYWFPLSGLILDRVHWFGLRSWRWLLIVEGLPAVACGILTYFLLPSRPAEAKFLSDDERSWITNVIALEEQRKGRGRDVSAMGALTDARVWHLALIGFTLFVGMYAVIFWMPQVVSSLSSRYSNTVVGLLVTIPYLVAVVAMIFVSRNSDKTLERRYHVAIPVGIAALALMSLAITTPAFVSIVILSVVVAAASVQTLHFGRCRASS
jgi:MFS transporter, ACS family, tartrate transporter